MSSNKRNSGLLLFTQFPIFLGVSLEKFVKLMSAKKPADFYHSEARQLFAAFDRQCKSFFHVEQQCFHALLVIK